MNEDPPKIRIDPTLFQINAQDLEPSPLAELGDRIWRDFCAAADQAREKLYWRMIANGQLPSMGWKMGERVARDGNRIRFDCWPIPPKEAR